MSPETPTAWPAAMKDKTAAAYLDLSRSKLWQLVATGDLPEPARLPGRVTRFLRDDLDQFLSQQSREGK